MDGLWRPSSVAGRRDGRGGSSYAPSSARRKEGRAIRATPSPTTAKAAVGARIEACAVPGSPSLSRPAARPAARSGLPGSDTGPSWSPV